MCIGYTNDWSTVCGIIYELQHMCIGVAGAVYIKRYDQFKVCTSRLRICKFIAEQYQPKNSYTFDTSKILKSIFSVNKKYIFLSYLET